MVHFQRDVGLCVNAAGFNLYWHGSTNIRREMQKQFIEAGLDDCYPFHEVEEDYYKEKDSRLNPKRLAWAKDHYQYPPHGQSKELTEFYGEWYKWAVAQSN